MAQTGIQTKIEKLNASNYLTWRGDMKSVLVLADLWEAIVGETADRIAGTARHTPAGASHQVVTPPTSSDRRIDAKAHAVLHVNVTKGMQSLVTDEQTALQAWTALQEMFKSSLTSRIIELKREWNNLQQEADESVMEFHMRVSLLRQQLKEVGVEYSLIDMFTQILDALLPKFEHAVTFLGLSDLSAVTKSEFLAKLQWVENSGKRADLPEAAIVCYGCGEQGHKKHSCPRSMKPSGTPRGKPRSTCEHCNGNHQSENCWREFPEQRPENNYADNEEAGCYTAEAYLGECQHVVGTILKAGTFGYAGRARQYKQAAKEDPAGVSGAAYLVECAQLEPLEDEEEPANEAGPLTKDVALTACEENERTTTVQESEMKQQDATVVVNDSSTSELPLHPNAAAVTQRLREEELATEPNLPGGQQLLSECHPDPTGRGPEAPSVPANRLGSGGQIGENSDNSEKFSTSEGVKLTALTASAMQFGAMEKALEDPRSRDSTFWNEPNALVFPGTLQMTIANEASSVAGKVLQDENSNMSLVREPVNPALQGNVLNATGCKENLPSSFSCAFSEDSRPRHAASSRGDLKDARPVSYSAFCGKDPG